VTGLKSPFGRRGSICAHFGWTWDYLHHGVAWSIVQRMMIDAPATEDITNDIELSDENADQVLKLLGIDG
jgi:hypothetical protein